MCHRAWILGGFYLRLLEHPVSDGASDIGTPQHRYPSSLAPVLLAKTYGCFSTKQLTLAVRIMEACFLVF